MHGVVMWRAGVPSEATCSPLITWEDLRCSRAWLAGKAAAGLSSGYGSASLLWLAEHAPEAVAPYGHAGTIADFLTAYLCGQPACPMDETMAASWGLFDTAKRAWLPPLARHPLLQPLLPPFVCAPGTRVGVTHGDGPARWALPPGLPVLAAAGDHPFTVLALTAHLPADTVATINVSTSSQFSRVLPADAPTPAAPVEMRPYFFGRSMAVVAPLTGGNAFSELEQLVESCLQLVDAPGSATKSDIYAAMVRAATPHLSDTSPTFSPLLWGERHAPDVRGSMAGVQPGNLRIGPLAAALLRGLVDNIAAMAGTQLLQGLTAIVGSGSALARNPALCTLIHQRFGSAQLLVLPDRDAAYGAALAAGTIMRQQ
jgi:sedoheptulokinase